MVLLEEKIRKNTIDHGKGKFEVTVVVSKLTQEEAREMFPYRPYNKYSESRFGGNTLYDDECLLITGLAKRCPMCRAPTKKEYLNSSCPDCDGRSEYNGEDPRKPIR